MVRYIGDARGGGGIPVQTEAAAYFALMSAAPSAAYKAAVNAAVYKWKRDGTWALIKGLWLHCADTSQAALLSVICDTPRDAVAVGTLPTFTARKGFSGFDASHQIKWPITSTILANDSVFPFLAGIITFLDNGAGSPQHGNFINSDAGSANSTPGHFYTVGTGTTGVFGAGPVSPIVPGLSAIGESTPVVIGSRGTRTFSPGSLGGSSSSSTTGRSSNYKTTALSNSPLARLSAYGFLASTATDTECRKFLTVLAECLNEIGALD